jgi:hypothetical protein
MDEDGRERAALRQMDEEGSRDELKATWDWRRMGEQGTQQHMADLMSRLSWKRKPVGWDGPGLVAVSDLRQADPSRILRFLLRIPKRYNQTMGQGPGMRARIKKQSLNGRCDYYTYRRR